MLMLNNTTFLEIENCVLSWNIDPGLSLNFDPPGGINFSVYPS